MANTLKKSADSLKRLAAGEKMQEQEETDSAPADTSVSSSKQKRKTVMIGAHFDPSARRVLALLQADPRNEGKQINDLLAEALNDLAAKYDVPQNVRLARDS